MYDKIFVGRFAADSAARGELNRTLSHDTASDSGGHFLYDTDTYFAVTPAAGDDFRIA